MRTAVPSLAGICPGAATTPGHAALLSEAEKDAKWMRQASAQGLAFHALVSEAPPCKQWPFTCRRPSGDGALSQTRSPFSQPVTDLPRRGTHREKESALILVRVARATSSLRVR